MTSPAGRGHQARRHARRAALQALYQWQMTAQDPADIERQFGEEQDMGRVDTEYFHDLVHGVAAGVDELDSHLAPLLDRPIPQVDPVERAILRLAAYELAQRPEVPYRVVINEAVDIARLFGAEQGHRYVNATLDRLARQLRPLEVGDPPPSG